MKNAVIFDCDGVIVNSEPIRFKSYQKLIFDEFGKDLPDKFYTEMLGRRPDINLEKFLSYLGLSGSIPELLKERAVIIEELFSNPENIIPIPGVVELIEKLERKYKLAVASSSSKPYLIRVLNNLKILEKFDAVISGDMVRNSKPSPEIFLLTAEKLQISPESCIVIEDSEHGVKGAKSAGMKCVALTTDLSKEKLLDSGADVIVDSLGDLNVEEILF